MYYYFFIRLAEYSNLSPHADYFIEHHGDICYRSSRTLLFLLDIVLLEMDMSFPKGPMYGRPILE